MCSKKGHINRDCFEREERLKKSAVNWKSYLNKSEVQNEAIGSSAELILMATENKLMTFPDDAKIVRYQNMWIGDTAATCYSTFRKSRKINL